MRKPNEDKLDEIIRNNNLKSNLIKWWNVNIELPDQQEDGDAASAADDKDAFSESNTVLYESILKDNSRDEDPFEKAMKQVKEDEDKSLQEANKVYERLLLEAQMDEDKKRQEIEEARRLAEANED